MSYENSEQDLWHSLQLNIDNAPNLAKATFKVLFACVFREASNVDLIGLEEKVGNEHQIQDGQNDHSGVASKISCWS